MTCLTFPRISLGTRGAASAVLDVTVRALEGSKDIIATVAPVPGLSVALSMMIALLKRIQVRVHLALSAGADSIVRRRT